MSDKIVCGDAKTVQFLRYALEGELARMKRAIAKESPVSEVRGIRLKEYEFMQQLRERIVEVADATVKEIGRK